MKTFLVSTTIWGFLGHLWFGGSLLYLLKILFLGSRPVSRWFSRAAAWKRKLTS